MIIAISYRGLSLNIERRSTSTHAWLEFFRDALIWKVGKVQQCSNGASNISSKGQRLNNVHLHVNIVAVFYKQLQHHIHIEKKWVSIRPRTVHGFVNIEQTILGMLEFFFIW